MPRRADVQALAGEILASPKYQHLDEAFVRRVAGEAAQRFRDQNDAVRYAKRKLHQAFGAFLTGAPADAVRACVAAIESGADARVACRAAMRAHVSTAERLPFLGEFYAQVAAWCGRPASVLDLACGLNPLALPWLPLAPDARYHCCDIDRDLVAALRGIAGVFGVEVVAQTCDLLTAPAQPAADLVLLLKIVTTLEQQRDGAARDLLAALDGRHLVISLPRRSIGARRNYVDYPVEDLLAGTQYRLADQAEFGDELVCHLVPA